MMSVVQKVTLRYFKEFLQGFCGFRYSLAAREVEIFHHILMTDFVLVSLLVGDSDRRGKVLKLPLADLQ